jgi:hypothetical protein
MEQMEDGVVVPLGKRHKTNLKSDVGNKKNKS